MGLTNGQKIGNRHSGNGLSKWVPSGSSDVTKGTNYFTYNARQNRKKVSYGGTSKEWTSPRTLLPNSR